MLSSLPCPWKEYSSSISFLLTRCPRPLEDRGRKVVGGLWNEPEAMISGEKGLNGVSGMTENPESALE